MSDGLRCSNRGGEGYLTFEVLVLVLITFYLVVLLYNFLSRCLIFVKNTLCFNNCFMLSNNISENIPAFAIGGDKIFRSKQFNSFNTYLRYGDRLRP